MKVRCIKNKRKDLRPYEYQPIKNGNILGRFGVTALSEYNEIVIGKEYLVMGIIIFQTYQSYLIDDSGFISACPCQLFEIVDNEIYSHWHFRFIDKKEDIYPFIQALFGYPELCSDERAYENLIVEREKVAQQIYFKRKIELEKIIEKQSKI